MKPVCPNYGANPSAHTLEEEKPLQLAAPRRSEEELLLSAAGEGPQAATKTPHRQIDNS